MMIVPEASTHRPAVIKLNLLAFGGEGEGKLIDALDRHGDIVSSLVALEDDSVVGHVLFSRLDVRVKGERVPSVALAPMAVSPQRQKQGIGSKLVKRGIADMQRAGQAAIVVLGHTAFYSRFGFTHVSVKNLDCPYNAYDTFMGLELIPGCLAGKVGICIYSPAFQELG